MRRAAAVLPLLLLCACEPVGIIAGAEGASVAVFGRGVGDIAVSLVSGRDCSLVRLDAGKTYCAPRERAPAALPFCSRTLADVQCWADPERLAVRPARVGDHPDLTPEQIAQINARWPKSLHVFGP